MPTEALEPLPTPAAAEASCALHRDARAVATCERCGNFLCVACRDPEGGGICLPCQERRRATAFPFNRENTSGLLGFCAEAFRRRWGIMSLASLLAFILPGFLWVFVFVAGFPDPFTRAATLPAFYRVMEGIRWTVALAAALLGLGMARLCRDVLREEDVRLGTLFSQFRRVGTLLGSAFFALVMLLPLPALVFLLCTSDSPLAPFLKKHVTAFSFEDSALSLSAAALLLDLLLFLPLVFVPVEIALNPGVGPLRAIRHAFAIAKGRRTLLWGWFLLAAGMSFAGMVLWLPSIWTLAFSALMLVGLHLALREGADVPPLGKPYGR